MSRPTSDVEWRDLLMEGKAPGVLSKRIRVFRSIYGRLPARARCKLCNVPFSGGGAGFARTVLRSTPSTFSMHLCNRCEGFARSEKPGAEVDVALLFADIRGSTTLAEQMSALEYSNLIDRFYTASSDVLIDHAAIVERLAGDQVAALFVPGLAGADYVATALQAASDLMAAYGYADADGPWIPVGAGVHRGEAFIGMVGTGGRMTELTSLGDPPNVTARLAGAAGSGEILVTQAAASATRLANDDRPLRELHLKGKADPMRVHVIAPPPFGDEA